MIIWIASYPKSGNTYLRSFLASYYYSEDGNFNFDQLLKIHQFPNIKFSKFEPNTRKEASKNWMFNQNAFFNKDKLNLVKTHNCLYPYEENNFTSKNQTLGAIYIVRDPRNVITSLENHYEMCHEEALKWITNLNKYIYDAHKIKEDQYSNFQFISSWSMNYKSWNIQKKNSNKDN